MAVRWTEDQLAAIEDTSPSLLVSAAAFSQQALGPASGIISPEINPDHTVTFRYRGPKAVTVQLTGDFLPTQAIEYEQNGQKMVYEAPGRVDLKEGRDGMWTYTSAPLTGELYSYSFIVDGVRTMDPNNIYQNRDIATWTNIFTLSTEKGDKGWYYEVHDVPHGSVAHVWYDSPTLGMKRRLSVYTPAGYEDNPKTKYPVLYLLHGSGVAVPNGDNDPELAAQFAAKPKLFWIAVGSADGVKRNSLILKDYCDAHGYPCEYYESDGGHIWRNWRVYLTLFAQRLFK